MSTEKRTADGMARIFVRSESRRRAFEGLSDLLGRKWNLPILFHLSTKGGMRFNQLEDEIDGVSAKMLSDSLKRLESRYGLVERRRLSDRPLRVEYALTETGRSLEPALRELTEWGEDHQSVLDGRES